MLLAANTILLIYVGAAVIPAILLMVYVYKQDKVEKEPIGLIFKLVGFGVLAALCSIVLEMIGESILNHYTNAGVIMDKSNSYYFILAFAIVAVVEEGTKALFTYWGSWKHPAFDYHFDGIVYAVSTSLGFAAFENVKYVFSYGLSVALPRAFLAIPGHMTFAVLFGIFYGRAKYYENLGGDLGKRGKRRSLCIGYLLAVLMHGTYDSCAMIGSELATLIYVGVVIVMYIICFVIVRKQAKNDYSLEGFSTMKNE